MAEKDEGGITSDNCTILPLSKAHVQFGGNEELTKGFPFRNVLKQSAGKTLQLAASPKLLLVAKSETTLILNLDVLNGEHKN